MSTRTSPRSSAYTQGVIERLTFIDVCDPALEELRRSSERRSKSLGDMPADESVLQCSVKRSRREVSRRVTWEEPMPVLMAGVVEPLEDGTPFQPRASAPPSWDLDDALCQTPVSVSGTISLDLDEDAPPSPEMRSMELPRDEPAEAVRTRSTPRRRRGSGRRARRTVSEGECDVRSSDQGHTGEQGSELNSIVGALYQLAKHCGAESSPGPDTSTNAAGLVRHLQGSVQQLRQPRSIARVLWALGKLEARGPDTTSVIAHLARASPPLLPRFSAQELSNSFWGLARLAPAGPARPVSDAAHDLAHAIAAESTQRITSLTAQCLSNSLWAMVRLGLRGRAIEEFSFRCAEEICGNREMHAFSPQGLANMLWALVKLSCGGATARTLSSVKCACVVIISQAEGRLRQFQPQELSMLAWATAKLHGRGKQRASGMKGQWGSGSNGGASAHCSSVAAETAIEHFLVELASEAQLRLPSFSPQGLSNVAWALATVEVLGQEEAHSFLLAAACASTPCLADFPPQAISNFCWAIARLRQGSGKVRRCSSSSAKVTAFVAAAASQATLRTQEFEWQDLSGIIVALAHGRHRIPEAIKLATDIVRSSTERCHELSTQVMLNIALSAARLGVAGDVLRPMVDEIGSCVAARTPRLNGIDLRQWVEVQRQCQPAH